ncbi:aromatic prenyltransferase [Aureobasidium pullulans EXF-150]|uniref:Aromatic prenyltransferase n=1 Tax=Aureobasidium pullulans EXF-150 TaxID=1043002 RepID=A0A074XJ90_AURPU|nr:aromatic prenyltransferase [Aureobasidium pullulans EXF-150]KEQ85578.1 aromatic prenyltransferase [Aureobasidium pullulans EXF-150]
METSMTVTPLRSRSRSPANALIPNLGVHATGLQYYTRALVGSSVSPTWSKINQWLPARGGDTDFWWKVTGSHLASMLWQAGYPPETQLEYLLFHHQVVVPYLGATPLSTTRLPYKSFMTDDFSPIEYSWKWKKDQKPEVRLSVELIGDRSGTATDLHNQCPTKCLFQQLSGMMSSVDMTWFDRFLEDFKPQVGQDDESIEWESSVFAGFELGKHEIGLKAYLVPRSRSCCDKFLTSGFKEAVSAVRGRNCELDAFSTLTWFLQNDPDGRNLNMVLLGIDCVEPSRSRMKVYMRTSVTSLAHTIAIMSLGGRRWLGPSTLSDVRQLWTSVLKLDSEFPETAELPVRTHQTSGILFYFDIKPTATIPDVKVYIPVRHYGGTDAEISAGLLAFMMRRFGSRNCAEYLDMLRGFAKQEEMNRTNGLQTYISFSVGKNGELDVTSYLSPQVHKRLGNLGVK